jgi:hypothetical protein
MESIIIIIIIIIIINVELQNRNVLSVIFPFVLVTSPLAAKCNVQQSPLLSVFTAVPEPVWVVVT